VSRIEAVLKLGNKEEKLKSKNTDEADLIEEVSAENERERETIVRKEREKRGGESLQTGKRIGRKHAGSPRKSRVDCKPRDSFFNPSREKNAENSLRTGERAVAIHRAVKRKKRFNSLQRKNQCAIPPFWRMLWRSAL